MKDGNAMIDEILSGPNPLDKLMRQDPKLIDPDTYYPAMVSVLRQDRAMFIKGEQQKKDKKAGVLVEDEPETEESEQ